MINLLPLQSWHSLSLYLSIAEYSKIDRSDSGNINLHTKSQENLELQILNRSISYQIRNVSLPVLIEIITHSHLQLKF